MDPVNHQNINMMPVTRQPQNTAMTTSTAPSAQNLVASTSTSSTNTHQNYFKPIVVSSHFTQPPNNLTVLTNETNNGSDEKEAVILDTSAGICAFFNLADFAEDHLLFRFL